MSGCGCRVEKQPYFHGIASVVSAATGDPRIVYCPLHGGAPEMAQAWTDLGDYLARTDRTDMEKIATARHMAARVLMRVTS